MSETIHRDEKFIVHAGKRTIVKPIGDMSAGEVLAALAHEAPDRAARLRDLIEEMRPDEFQRGPLQTTIALWWPQGEPRP